ncbi:MAG: VOC family protein [Sphingobacteriales bacterium]|nr:MAG: VOC family protein [Sphingobacteriales bacterium]
MAQVNPYFNFNGNCREAMNFYKDCIGGELKIMSVSDTPMAEQMPDMKDNVMHSQLEKNGSIILMASDMMRGKPNDGNTVSIMINCESEEEINNVYKKLSEGGEILDELKLQFWGDIFG